MSPRYCRRSPLRAVPAEHLALSLCPSLLVPLLCARPHRPDGVSISPSSAASQGGASHLPLLYPRTKITCVCSLILLRVYKTPSFPSSLFILYEISLASPLSLLKASVLTRHRFHPAAVSPSIPNEHKHSFLASLPMVLSTFVSWVFFPIFFLC